MANEFTIIQTACGTYNVTTTYVANPLHGFIRNYKDPVLTLAEMQAKTPDVIITAGEPDVDITLVDGVYVLQLYDTITTTLEYSIPIFVWCSIQTCLNSFNDKLLCSEECPDCSDCDPCTEAALEERLIYQYEMIKLQTLFWVILGYLNWWKVEYNDVYDWGNMETFVTKVGKMMDKILVITARCGACS